MPRIAPATPSTFERQSGNSRLPSPGVYLAALVLFAAMIGGLEAYWRLRGFIPDVPDSADLWAYHRSRVVGNDAKLVVAIGTSRIRTDLRSDVIRQRLPSHHFIQLGINGPSSSIGLLAEISRIPRFCGLVLCDVLPPLMDSEQEHDQVSLNRMPIPQALSLNTYLRCLLCDRLVVLNSALTFRQCIAAHGVLRPNNSGPRLRVHADRTLDVGYTSAEALKATTEAKLQSYAEMYARAKRYENIDEFKQAVANVGESVARIRHNGGQVVFLRLPASGARLKLEESAFPSATYFGALASVTAAPWIDFRELSRYGDFDCQDESHLSPQGARIFTARLVEELRLRALLGQRDVLRPALTSLIPSSPEVKNRCPRTPRMVMDSSMPLH
jgi:hypothetical protein